MKRSSPVLSRGGMWLSLLIYFKQLWSGEFLILCSAISSLFLLLLSFASGSVFCVFVARGRFRCSVLFVLSSRFCCDILFHKGKRKHPSLNSDSQGKFIMNSPQCHFCYADYVHRLMLNGRRYSSKKKNELRMT